MSNLVPFQQSQAPAFLQQLGMTPQQIAAMNAGAAIGTGGGGAVNKISLKAAKFRLIVGGQETQILPVLNLQLVAVRVNDGISKVYYEKEWSPDQENVAPDCSSDDGIAPRADSPKKQCGPDGTCQNCPQNQWGSKINRLTGGKIKACSDTKRMAVIAPGQTGRFTGEGDLYQLSIPPASLQDFGTYVRQLQTLPTPVPYNAVVTDVAFDTAVSYPKLLFKGVRYLEADEYAAISKLYNEDATKRVAGLAEAMAAPTNTQLPAPIQQPAQQAQQPMQQAQQPQQSQGYVDPNAGGFAQPAQQQVQQQAPAGWGQPQQAPVQQQAGWGQPQQVPVQQQAPAGWGQPQQAPIQQPVQQAPIQQAARVPGQPSAGRKRRTKEEIAEDDAFFAAQNGQQQAPVQQAQVQQTQQPVQQAPAGWGQPQQAPVQQQAPQQAGWGQPQQVQQAPAQQPATFDASNPFAQAPGVVQQGAPIQPGVTTDPGMAGAFAGWDDVTQ